MDILLTTEFWAALGSIILANVLLSGDNAVVIAMAARGLPARQQKSAILLGSGAAIVMRIVLTLIAVRMLGLPWLKLVGGLALLWIGAKLLVDENRPHDADAQPIGVGWASASCCSSSPTSGWRRSTAAPGRRPASATAGPASCTAISVSTMRMTIAAALPKHDGLLLLAAPAGRARPSR